MAKQLSVLFVSSEVFPFSKESELADVSFSLPLKLKEFGSDVRVMMPKYGHISERRNKIHDINRLRDMPVPIGGTEDFATIKSSSIQNTRSKVQTYVTTNDKYFNQLKGIYHDLNTGDEFENNAERFIFFCRSVVETCIILNWFPDIIHVNNWQSALVPAFAKTIYPSEFEKTKFIFTVHDFSDQGDFPWASFKTTGIPEGENKNFKHKNKFNFLKAGLIYSDVVTCLSEETEKNILKNPDMSDGLNAIAKPLKENFVGINTGIDKWMWNPVKDNYLEHKLTDDDFDAFKYDNKVELCNKFELDFHPKRPIFGMVTKIIPDSGFDLLIGAADKIFAHDLQIVVLAQGHFDKIPKLEKLAEKYPDKLKIKYKFEESMQHLVTAGSDYLLMPEKYNASALNFQYGCVFGTPPVVFVSGGISEIAEFWDGDEEGTSIEIKKYDKESLADAVSKAVELFAEPDTWRQMAKNGTYEEFAWANNAKQFEVIYRRVLNK